MSATKDLVPHPVLLLACGLVSLAATFALPQPVKAQSQASPAVARLNKMFSPEIQATMAACAQQGGVNLAAGADRDGSVICGNGWRQSPVKHAVFLDTITDFLGASFLIGIRGGMQILPEAKPELLSQILSTPEGIQSLQKAFEQSVMTTSILAKNSPKSVKILSDQVMARMLPTLRNPAKLTGLLGTAEEYSQISQNFCPSPGMSIKRAKALTPNLSSVQIYAICVQESGLTDELVNEARKQQSR